MKSLSSKPYHLFLVLAALNLLTFYFFVGNSTLDVRDAKGFFSDEIFNYFLCVSVLIVAIWLSYWILRKKLTSRKLMWLHLLITFVTVFVLPWVLRLYPLPRRYVDYNPGFKLNFFGTATGIFIVEAFMLLTSEIFLILNIRQQPKTLKLFDNDN